MRQQDGRLAPVKLGLEVPRESDKLINLRGGEVLRLDVVASLKVRGHICLSLELSNSKPDIICQSRWQ